MSADSSRHERVKALFLEACARAASEREAWLRQAALDDPGVVDEVLSLLAHHHEAAEPEHEEPPPPRSAATPRFAPGTVFAERYRIVSRIGYGGMGEVYLAEDQVLKVQVALKLLLPDSPDRGDLLLHEVRLARTITHAAVCRVYDAGRAGGEYFLTMEYVDGEDLGTLLRRIGRLPSDKVIEIARTLTSALAAAHDKGVLHRDLKPSNVLIDRNGQVKITDFGIAIAGSDAPRLLRWAGTPAYMAPEQFTPAGRATPASDIYALGLLLHELLTGQPVFRAESRTGYFDKHASVMPEAPSRLVTDVDPKLERVIVKALEKDPARRHPSVLHMAAALPGMDTLAAALEAHVTPSPELVAQADEERLGQARAWWTMAALVLTLIAVFSLADKAYQLDRLGLEKSPTHQAIVAGQTLRALGYPETDMGRAHGYLQDPTTPDSTRSVLFWYREEAAARLPAYVKDVLYGASELNVYELTPGAPPARIVTLTTPDGRLLFLEASPILFPDRAASESDRTSFDPSALLARAGLAQAPLEPIEPAPPHQHADAWHAWRSPVSASGSPLRIEMAALDGRPVYFAAGIDPARSPAGLAAKYGRFDLLNTVVPPVLILVFGIAIVLGIRNLRSRRIDRQGATRLVRFVLVAKGLAFVLLLGHVTHPLQDTGMMFLDRIVNIMVTTILTWWTYVAFEPLVRRLWPRTLISWSRLLHGQWRDPLVGRALLVGCLVGALWTLLDQLDRLLPAWLGMVTNESFIDFRQLVAALGIPELLGGLLNEMPQAISNAVTVLLLLAVLRVVLKRNWLAAVPFVIIVGTLEMAARGHGGAASWVLLAFGFALPAVFVLTRLGLLTYVVATYVRYILTQSPITGDLAAWYATNGLVPLVLVAGVGLAGMALAIQRPRLGPGTGFRAAT